MSLIDLRHDYHKEIRMLFYKWLNKTNSQEELTKLRTTIYNDNNKQWAPLGTNIIKSSTNCPQLCRYCYNIAWKHRKDKLDIPDIEDYKQREMFEIDEKRVNKGWMKAKTPKIYIFGSTHDIFPEMVDDYIKVATKILEAGNEILVVSKARFDCIKKVCNELIKYKNQIMIICTITSNIDDTLNYWEPNAPDYKERLKALKYAHKKGYRTSVSLEPYLSDPRPIITSVKPYVTNAIWLGEMNHCKELEFDDEQYDKIEELYTLDYVKKLILEYEKDDKVFYKYGMFRTVGLKGKRETDDI